MNDTKDCQALLTHLSDYVDDSLEDEALCREIEGHIASCEDCQIVVDTLKKTIYLYHTTADRTEMPSAVRHRLYKRLDLEPYLNSKKQG